MRTHLLRCWLCSSFERLDEADPEWNHRLLGMSPLTAELVCYLLMDSRCADGLSVHNRSTLQTLEELPQGVTESLSSSTLGYLRWFVSKPCVVIDLKPCLRGFLVGL